MARARTEVPIRSAVDLSSLDISASTAIAPTNASIASSTDRSATRGVCATNSHTKPPRRDSSGRAVAALGNRIAGIAATTAGTTVRTFQLLLRMPTLTHTGPKNIATTAKQYEMETQ